MSTRSRCPILVLGIGNILLRDEGVGVRVIEQMQKMHLPDGVELIDGGTAGADLLDVLAERKKVIVIDAVQADCEPGTVLRCTADDLVRPDGVGMSLHELGLGEALTMTRQLGCAPEEVVVFGIRPRELGCGLELSEEITEMVPKVVELVLAEITGSVGEGPVEFKNGLNKNNNPDEGLTRGDKDAGSIEEPKK